jgi:hypothetical protein
MILKHTRCPSQRKTFAKTAASLMDGDVLGQNIPAFLCQKRHGVIRKTNGEATVIPPSRRGVGQLNGKLGHAVGNEILWDGHKSTLLIDAGEVGGIPSMPRKAV